MYFDRILHVVCTLFFIFSFCYQIYSDGITNNYSQRAKIARVDDLL